MPAGLELLGAIALPILALSALYARYRVLRPVSHMAAVLHELPQRRAGHRVDTVIDAHESRAISLTAAPDSGLRGAIVQMLRGHAVGHDRRKAVRLIVTLPARLEYRGTTFPGVVLNMSQGGVRFRQDDGVDLPQGAIASLIVRGMPSVAVQVMEVRSGLASLAFAFQSNAEREDFAAFVEEIGDIALAA